MQNQKMSQVNNDYTGQTVQSMSTTSDSSQFSQPYYFFTEPSFIMSSPVETNEENLKDLDEEILKAVEKTNYEAVLSPAF